MGHDHIILHNKAINKSLNQLRGPEQKSVEYHQFLEIVSRFLPVNMNGYKKKMNDALHIRNELKGFSIYNVSENELLKLLAGVAEINSEFKSIATKTDTPDLTDINEESLSKLQSLLNALSLPGELDLQNPGFKAEFGEMMKSLFAILVGVIPPYCTLNMLGFFFSDLVRIRYPEITDNFDPIRIFKRSHPLVKYYPQLYKTLCRSINDLASIMKVSSGTI